MGESLTGLATQIPARSWVWRKSNEGGSTAARYVEQLLQWLGRRGEVPRE